MNRLDGSFGGPVLCLVSTDVYSHDREHVLIPAGTKVLGEAQKVNAFGQDRLAVFFHRLIMPVGYAESLDQFKGLDQQGATALHDKVNNHYAKIFGASLAVGHLGRDCLRSALAPFSPRLRSTRPARASERAWRCPANVSLTASSTSCPRSPSVRVRGSRFIFRTTFYFPTTPTTPCRQICKE